MQERTSPIFAAVLALGALGAAAAPAGAEEIFAVTTRSGSVAPSIFHFDSATPSVISPLVPLTGGVPIAIDFRPATGQLYGVGSLSDNRLFTIDTATGAVSAVGRISPPPGSAAVGLDFNPTTDELRATIVEPHPFAQRANLRIDPATGASVFEGNLRYAPGDPNAGRVAGVVGAAYTNNVAGAQTTRLYGIDSNTGALVSIDPESAGTLRTVGSLGISPTLLRSDLVGFDISGVSGTAYAAVAPIRGSTGSSALPQLYTVNLDTGAATLVGAIGDGTVPLSVVGMSVAPAPSEVIPEPGTLLLVGTGLLGAGAAAMRRRRKERKSVAA